MARIDLAAGGAVDFEYLPNGKCFLTSIDRAKSQVYLLRDFYRPVRLIDRWLGK